MASDASNPCDGLGGFEYEIGDDESATLAVVRALSAATGTDPTEIPPLYDSLDPDSLNSIATSFSGEYRIEFTHHGYRVALVDGATIELVPAAE